MRKQLQKSIIEVMEDPELFGGTFKKRMLRGDSWARWKVFLRALFGLGLDASGRKTFEAFTGRTDSPAQPFREAFAICGRRSGKSFIAALIAVYVACFRNYDAVLAAGEIGTVLIVGSDRAQCRVILGYVNGMLSIPVLQKLVTNRLKESVELGRIRIEVATCDYRALRGSTVICAICDEVAFWRSDDSSSPDTEVLRAIRPSMTTIPNALLLCISSPYGKRGALFDAYRDHFGKSSDVLVWKSSSRGMNPTLSQATIARAYLADPQAARSEYGGEFRDDVSSFLSPEVVDGRVVRNRLEIPPMPGTIYSAFTDPSGGSSDSFTLAIGFWDSVRSLAVLACLREVPAPFSPESAVAELAGVLKKYRCGEVVGDRYAAAWPAEAFAKQGITYRAAELTRSELYLELLPALMSNLVELLDNSRLISQLCGLERRTSRSGKDSVDHGASAHDDVANAAAGCLVEILRASGSGGVLGLLNYEKGLGSGQYSETQLQPTNSKLFAVEIPACPVCGASCTSQVANVFRCGQCALQWRAGDKTFSVRTETLTVGCPACGESSLWRFFGAAGGSRCGHCAYQEDSPLPKNGISRRDAESFYEGKAQMNSGGFRRAMARLLAGGK